MIDLMKIPASDAERIAYAEGLTLEAELFKRIAELEAELEAAHQQISDLWGAQQ